MQSVVWTIILYSEELSHINYSINLTINLYIHLVYLKLIYFKTIHVNKTNKY